ncbi:MAG: hypothetical protein EP329_01400 [Deltaproteobacteria bacterium]|nr:MAG: hypothetical protein EP329_01400 [Deltaproteobacteria bacterium]
MRLLTPSLLLAASLLVAACGDEVYSDPVDTSPPDTADTSDTADTADTALPVDTVVPVADPVTPVPLLADGWLAASILTTSDPVGEALARGTFTTPQLGVDASGIAWGPATPDENGAFLPFVAPTVYLAGTVHVDAPTGVVGRFDNARSIWVDGQHRQPGELYGGAEPVRVPLVLPPGDHTVVVAQARPQRAIRVQLEATTDAVHFNLEDVTAPDLVVGQSDTQWLGVHVLNLSGAALLGVRAEVVESDRFAATRTTLPALAPGAFTQLSFELVPKAPWQAEDEEVTVRLHLASPDLTEAYEREVTLSVVPIGARHRRTFRSPVDGSTQYYGVLPPTTVVPGETYGLILSLHGAGDRAIDANAWYTPKDWAYVISPTNRRRFGFDWEEWGHDNALNALADARAAFPIDPLRVHATGVSMGGHGTWHLAAMHPDRFATFTPSAGWRSFYSYTGDPEPTGAFARARAHSRTIDFLDNLAGQRVYIIHGGEDPVVPVREARDMYALLQPITDDVTYHEEPGAGHFWRSAEDDTVNCANWPPALDQMEAARRVETPLDFAFRSPAPWYSPSSSYVTVTSVDDPYADFTVTSEHTDADRVALTTTNVRSMVIDMTALSAAGVAWLDHGGVHYAVDGAGELPIGPEDGKQLGLSGPYNQVFRQPFGFVYPDGDALARDYAAYLVSTWAAIGNGQAFALPYSALASGGPLDAENVPSRYNLVYVGFPGDAMAPDGLPFDWGPDGVTVDGEAHPDAALLLVTARDRLGALLYAPPGREHLLYRVIPFSSRSGMPDYLVWNEDGAALSGFLDAGWGFDPGLAR